MSFKYKNFLALIGTLCLVSFGVTSSASLEQQELDSVAAEIKISKEKTQSAQNKINELNEIAFEIDNMIISELSRGESLAEYAEILDRAEAIVVELKGFNKDPEVRLKGFNPAKPMAVINRKRALMRSLNYLGEVPSQKDLAAAIYTEIQDLEKQRIAVNYYEKRLSTKIKATKNPNLAKRLQPYFYVSMLNEANDALNFLEDVEETQTKLERLTEQFKMHSQEKTVLLSQALIKNAALLKINKATYTLAKEIAEAALAAK